MIYVDASALAAIILGEAEAARFISVLADARASEPITSPIAVFEAIAGVARSKACSVADARALVDDLLDEAGVLVVELTPRHGELAVTAWERFGKGRHPAALNMGDCLGYAVAKAARAPILFKGGDFAKTDLIDYASPRG
jgi:ribonuclease VapC